MDTNTNSENMNIVGSSSGNGVNNGNDSHEDNKDGMCRTCGKISCRYIFKNIICHSLSSAAAKCIHIIINV